MVALGTVKSKNSLLLERNRFQLLERLIIEYCKMFNKPKE